MDSITRRRWLTGLLSLPPALLTACGGGGGNASGVSARLRATPWPAAEALFRGDPQWLGGDAVYSIDLGAGRVLYLFGDSFIATSPARTRTESILVRNSAAIQTGYDPTSAALRFYWDASGTAPDALIRHPDPNRWYWPLHGARLGASLIVFLSENVATSTGLGFRAMGWAAAVIDNPDAEPSQWSVTVLPTRSDFGLVLGAAVVSTPAYLYAYATPLPQPSAVSLARWPLDAAVAGGLSGTEWYTDGAWATSNMVPDVLMSDGQAEFGVSPGQALASFALFQTDAFGAANIAYRLGDGLTGPWSDPVAFYRPPEASRADALVYSAKVHPMLTSPSAAFVVSYSANSTDFQTLLLDESLYFPKFLQVSEL